MTPNLDVDAVQQALDTLIAGDDRAAVGRFTDDVVLRGGGGCLDGEAAGLAAVLDRFAAMAQLTDGTFGTEVEAVYSGHTPQIVVVTRHWASLRGEPIQATQALVVTSVDGRISTMNALSRTGHPSGIWD